jgi:hypothetical protein
MEQDQILLRRIQSLYMALGRTKSYERVKRE